MDKIAWQKPFSSASDFAIKKSKEIHNYFNPLLSLSFRTSSRFGPSLGRGVKALSEISARVTIPLADSQATDSSNQPFPDGRREFERVELTETS